MSSIKFAFFGTPELAVLVLNTLMEHGYEPAVVITAPDRPQGRGLKIVSPPAALWAKTHSIELIQPQAIDSAILNHLSHQSWDVFIVAAYGKLLPKLLLDMPKHGVLNVHPSLLPKLRGASPIQSAVLTDQHETGVSIMLLDEKMDHGPIVAQKKIAVAEWPPYADELETKLAREGALLLANVLPDWIEGVVSAKEQDHAVATFCKKITKADGEIDLVNGNAYQNLLKIRGLAVWPGAFTFFERGDARIRVTIEKAHIADGTLVLDTVKPEGKNSMAYMDFARSGAIALSSLAQT